MQLISVIVPVFNGEQFLERCIKSIQNQSFRSIEIIIVNDGSTDKSKEICEKYAMMDKRIVIINKENGGLSSARNKGIEAASGDYIGFVDCDDYISYDMYEYLFRLISENDADIVSGSYRKVKYSDDKYIKNWDDAKRERVTIFNRNEAVKFYLKQANAPINDFPVWTKLYKREMFCATRFPEGYIYEDMATNFKMICKCKKYIKSSKVLYYYFQNTTGITKSSYNAKQQDLLIACENIVNIAKQSQNIETIKYALTVQAKGCFSLLVKIIKSDEALDGDLIKHCVVNIKRYYKSLIISKMSLVSKIVLTFMCIDIKFCRMVFKFLKRITSPQKRSLG